MKIIKTETTLENLTFNVILTQDLKNLGLALDVNEDSTTIKQAHSLKYKGESKLDKVRSYDFNEPYILGVNGVFYMEGDIIKYHVDGVEYETNLVTDETNIIVNYTDESPENNNFIRVDDMLGLVDKPTYNSIDIEREQFSVIESFGKLQQIRNLNEFESFGNEYYTVHNQSF